MLPDGRFSIADIPDESPAAFAPISPALSEEELQDELVRRGVDRNIVDDLIGRTKRKGVEVF
jgi:hypothetical protein